VEEFVVRPPDEVRWRARRGFRFARIAERFDLVAFRDVADWLAREPGGIDRSEDRRRQALADLRRAVSDGEFGPPHKPVIAYMPRVALRDLPLRVNAAQIEICCTAENDIISDIWAPRALVARWFTAYGLNAPPWLTGPPAATESKHRGPEKGALRRYLAADRELFPEIKRLIRDEQLSVTGACQQLAQKGKVKGIGSLQSRATRLARAYRAEKLVQTLSN
jgi:hypothetical protein